MKLIDIALKDIVRSFRNAMFLIFGLALPLLTAGLFYLAFGGTGSDDGGFELAEIQVQVVNLDQGQAGFAGGEILVTSLQRAMPGILQVTEVADAASARSAVDQQAAAVAVIIPDDFSAAVFEPEGQAAVEIYHDPTLIVGPSIVTSIVSQVVDGFAGSKIAAFAALDQFLALGLPVDATLLQRIATDYGTWSAELSEQVQGGDVSLFEVRAPAGAADQANGTDVTSILGLIMAGMMVFYVFFTGAAAAGTILQEEEAGTLPRLFTTPTSQATILGGKFASAFLLLAVQVVVLVIIANIVFGVAWGNPLLVALVILGLVVVAASFGLFVTSLLKNYRQGGIIYGGVLTVMGMVGMLPVFTSNVPGSANTIKIASLAVPQGWAVRGWQLLLEGGSPEDILITVAVMLAAGAVFFAIGVLRFRKRYA